VGLVVRNFRDVVPALRQFLVPERLAAMKRNTIQQRSRAVFEIPEFISGLLGIPEQPQAETSEAVHAF
jgi:hypothetical protein